MSGKRRILILEDDKKKYMDLVMLLKKMDISDITWFNNAEEGIAAFKEGKKSFDAVISDMHYPYYEDGEPEEDTGLRLIAALKEADIPVPVIIVSSVHYNVPEAYAVIWYQPERNYEDELRKVLESL